MKKVKLKVTVVILLLLLLCGMAFVIHKIYGVKLRTAALDKDKLVSSTVLKTPLKADDSNVSDGSDLNSVERITNTAQPVTLIMSSNPVFETADSVGSWRIINSEKNTDLLMQVEVTRKDTGQLIYVSPLLKENNKVEADYLSDKTLLAGSHKALATFYFYTAEDEALYYSTAVAIDIDILK